MKSKLKVKDIKRYLKKKFNIKKKFFLTCNENILDDSLIINSNNYKRFLKIKVVLLKNKNRACLSFFNRRVIITVATFFRYFMKVDFQLFDSILNTIKYSNQSLYQLLLKKKISFVNQIFFPGNEKKIYNLLCFEGNIHKFFESFPKIFFNKNNNSKASSGNLKYILQKKLSSENSRNLSPPYFYENISKSSNVSKVSNNYNQNSPSRQEDLFIQRSIDFTVVNDKYLFFDENIIKRLNNFINIQ